MHSARGLYLPANKRQDGEAKTRTRSPPRISWDTTAKISLATNRSAFRRTLLTSAKWLKMLFFGTMETKSSLWWNLSYGPLTNTSMKFGRGYTLRFQWNASAGYDQLYLHLSRSFKYNIFIHDHEYFLVSENPLTMPTRLVTFDPNQTFSHYERLLVTEHQLIDNCEPEPGYSFQTCVQKVNIIPVKQNSKISSLCHTAV